MKISIIAAAKLLDISAHLLRWRIVHQHVLKFATHSPQTVKLADVLRYRSSCSRTLKKSGRPSASAVVLSDLTHKLVRASTRATTGAVARTIPSRRRSGSSTKKGR